MTIVSLGFLTNLRAMFAKLPAELVSNQVIEKVVISGGAYPDSRSRANRKILGGKVFEWDFSGGKEETAEEQSRGATKYILEKVCSKITPEAAGDQSDKNDNLNIPCIFAGHELGANVLVGGYYYVLSQIQDPKVPQIDQTNVLYRASKAYFDWSKKEQGLYNSSESSLSVSPFFEWYPGHGAWDSAAVLVAVRGGSELVHGTNRLREKKLTGYVDDGSNLFEVEKAPWLHPGEYTSKSAYVKGGVSLGVRSGGGLREEIDRILLEMNGVVSAAGVKLRHDSGVREEMFI